MPFYVSSGLYVGRECVSCAQVYVLSVCSGFKVKLEVAISKFNILSLLYYTVLTGEEDMSQLLDSVFQN